MGKKDKGQNKEGFWVELVGELSLWLWGKRASSNGEEKTKHLYCKGAFGAPHWTGLDSNVLLLILNYYIFIYQKN